jgi:hypothetical protein
MRTLTSWRSLGTTLICAGLLAASLFAGRALANDDPSKLPRFTEEREAAALFFVKKQLPELLPFLDELKKKNATEYQREIREIFQVTEMLADLSDEPERHRLELEIWKTENKAHTLVAKLSTPNEEERKKLEAQLQELARDLVELDIKVLKLKAEQLDKELGEVNDELAKMKENRDKEARERFEGLVNKAKKMKK